MPRIHAHPGEVLREEFMKPLGLSANALALALRVPATRIGDILRAKKPRAVSADTAIRLGRYFGTTPEFWLNLQAAYDLSVTLAESGREIARDVHPREHRAGHLEHARPHEERPWWRENAPELSRSWRGEWRCPSYHPTASKKYLSLS